MSTLGEHACDHRCDAIGGHRYADAGGTRYVMHLMSTLCGDTWGVRCVLYWVSTFAEHTQGARCEVPFGEHAV